MAWRLVGFFQFNIVAWILLAYLSNYLISLEALDGPSQGQSLGSLAHWVMNAVISGVFPALAARSGALPFLFFALMMVVQFFVVLVVYPETKNVSLEKLKLQ
jgi:hypothetical protein